MNQVKRTPEREAHFLNTQHTVNRELTSKELKKVVAATQSCVDHLGGVGYSTPEVDLSNPTDREGSQQSNTKQPPTTQKTSDITKKMFQS